MNLIKKVSIILLCIIIISFCVPGRVRAEVDGGKLLDPIVSLVVSIGDGIMTLLQKVVLNMEDAVINIDTTSSMWSKIIVGVVFVAATAIAIWAIVASRRYSINNSTWNCKSSYNYRRNRCSNLSYYNRDC